MRTNVIAEGPAEEAKADRALVRSVRRAAAILKAFHPSETYLGANELARRLHLLPSTVHRIASSLVAEGLLESDRETGKYRLGLEILRLGRVALAQRGLRDQAMTWMNRLAGQTKESVHLGTLVDGMYLIVEWIESEHSLRAGTKLGEHMYLHCTAGGKVLLAQLSEAEVDRIIETRGLPRRTPKTIVDVGELKRQLVDVRRQGFAVDDEENGPGVRCIGAPIFDHRGQTIAALVVAGPAERLSLPRLFQLKDDVVATAERVSRDLGWFPR